MDRFLGGLGWRCGLLLSCCGLLRWTGKPHLSFIFLFYFPFNFFVLNSNILWRIWIWKVFTIYCRCSVRYGYVLTIVIYLHDIDI
jgi:hypothetical protein